MKYPLYLLFLAIVGASPGCETSDEALPVECVDCAETCFAENGAEAFDDDCRDNWTCSYATLTDARVDPDSDLGTAAGFKTVLRMESSTEGNPGIADDEFTNTLVLEVPAGRTAFAAEGDGLAALNLHYRVRCYCAGVAFRPLTEGCIRGSQLADGSWSVQARLRVGSTGYEDFLYVDARFRRG